MKYLLTHTILESASRFPDHDAFRFVNNSLTYSELANKMNQLSRLLIASGVRRGDRVGVYLNRSLETAIALYGIMNAGAAYVPLDPHAPAKRTRFLIKNGDIKILVTNPSQKRTLQKVLNSEVSLKKIIGLQADWEVETIPWEAVDQLSTATAAVPRILENDLAYIMYTSGSTGAPKGIMHTHSSGLSYARLSADLYGLTPQDVIGNHAPIHFDISTLGYFSSPLVGATTVIVSEAHTKMPASLSLLLEKEKVTVWYSVPLALIQILQKGVLEQRDWSALRWILYGGEPFPTKHLRELMQRLPHTRWSNVYGPAEVNQCTYYHLPDLPKEGASIPLGQVWENTEMLILDKNDKAVTQGETGELLIRSATMMRGYWKQPELTQQSLFKRITVPGVEEVFYKTGDLVSVNADGHLTFQGRKDRQIKTRGYRVELDEVEATFLGHEAVHEVAVFSIKNKEEGLLISAVVILKDKETVTEQELSNYLKERLPWYAVPQKISIETILPRTTTGKINRNALQLQSLNNTDT